MKKNDRISKSKAVDPERETRVLLEDIRMQVQTVAEGHDVLSRKLDDIDGRFGKIESTFFKNEWTLESIKSKTGTIDQKIDRIESAVLDISNVMKDQTRRVTRLEENIQT